MHVFVRRAWPIVAVVVGAAAACGPDPTPATLSPRAEAGLASALSQKTACLIVPTTSVTADSPGMCLDVRNGAREQGAIVQLWDCSGADGQQFSRDGNNLRVFDDLCLAVAEGREVVGGGVQVDTCDLDFLNQGWIFAHSRMQLEGTDLCLEVVNGIITRGGGMQLAACNADAEGQRFAFNDADEVTGPGSPGSRRRAPADDNAAAAD